MKKKMLVSFLLISLIPLGIILFLSINSSTASLDKAITNHLISMREAKIGSIESFFKQRENDITLLSKTKIARESLFQLTQQYPDGLQGEIPKLDKNAEDYFENLLSSNNYDDIFLIDQNGELLYSVSKESDLGTNLVTGPYKNTGLAQAFSECKNGYTFADYTFYEPTNKPAAFLAYPLLNEDGSPLGVIALQISDASINEIMQSDQGLGETGEIYLVGNDYLMRSNSRFSDEPSIGKEKVETASAKKAFAGNSGTGIIQDYRGVEVLSAYSPIQVNGLNWVIIAEMDKEEAFAPIQTLMWQIIIMVVILTIIVIAFAFTFANRLAKPILVLRNELNDLAHQGGDLTKEIMITSKDEIGELAKATNDFIKNIRGIVRNVKLSAEQAAASSHELSVSAEETEQTTNQVATAIGEIANGANHQANLTKNILHKLDDSVEEVMNVREKAEELLTQAQKTTIYTHDGEKAISEAILHLITVSDSVQQASESVQKLGKRSKEINHISTVITDISEQTNLLALNAAIESARAGVHGNGFKVVADEIRKLAEQSNQNASKISLLIDTIQTEIEQTVNQMINNSKSVQAGVNMIQEGGLALKQIVERISTTEKISNEVKTYFITVENRIQQIFEVIQHVASITQQTAAASEEVSASAEEQTAIVEEIAQSSVELAHIAEKLQSEVDKFII